MSTVFQIFEGQCPFCEEGELVLAEAAGYVEWLREHNYLPQRPNDPRLEVSVWQRHGDEDGLEDQGVLTFKCLACGKTVEVYANSGGDWAASC